MGNVIKSFDEFLLLEKKKSEQCEDTKEVDTKKACKGEDCDDKDDKEEEKEEKEEKESKEDVSKEEVDGDKETMQSLWKLAGKKNSKGDEKKLPTKKDVYPFNWGKAEPLLKKLNGGKLPEGWEKKKKEEKED